MKDQTIWRGLINRPRCEAAEKRAPRITGRDPAADSSQLEEQQGSCCVSRCSAPGGPRICQKLQRLFLGSPPPSCPRKVSPPRPLLGAEHPPPSPGDRNLPDPNPERARTERVTSALPQQQEAEKQGSGGIAKQQQI
ncbi:unnamed protein product [Pleuronectes platessa]|uniref:Uncharacterized protein n=1 Tax=Pleuronectes platessa TaxID=8262 RepID=A0A9N7TKT0_PLEPL|nr:unnamed protein product [Pleuronectes platessa]